MSIPPGQYLAREWGEKQWTLTLEGNPGVPADVLGSFESLSAALQLVRQLDPSGGSGFWVQRKGGTPEKRNPFE